VLPVGRIEAEQIARQLAIDRKPVPVIAQAPSGLRLVDA
jgi:hypothetical protein